MLLREPGLHCLAVGVEGGNGGGRGLSHQKAWRVQEEQQAADHGYFSRMCGEAFLHDRILLCFEPGKQCKEPHAVKIVPHGASHSKHLASEDSSLTQSP